MIREYAKWYESMPFDIGQTCSFAFEAASETVNESINSVITEQSVNAMFNIINDLNKGSEANGALMRSTAIASYVVNYESNIIDDMLVISDTDCSLSHPNQVCKDVNRIYLFAITHLLTGKSPQEVLELTSNFINDPKSNIVSDKVKQWFFEESLDISELNCKRMIGHVRWGFVLAIYFLRHPEIDFEDAIKITLMKGGDTDTNAAIVGGMVGSYHTIPEYMLKPVLEFDCTKSGHIRPCTYGVKHVLKL
jgi:ADP-ribosylglycohydrolase